MIPITEDELRNMMKDEEFFFGKGNIKIRVKRSSKYPSLMFWNVHGKENIADFPTVYFKKETYEKLYEELYGKEKDNG